MKILPFEKFEIKSDKSKNEIIQALSSKIQPWSIRAMFKGGNAPLTGKFGNGKFKAHRPIKYRNSFLPIAVINIQPESSGSRIMVSLRMNLFAICFMSFWLLAVAAAIALISHYKGFGSLIPLGMFVFGYGIMQAGFWSEVPKIKSLLREAVEKCS